MSTYLRTQPIEAEIGPTGQLSIRITSSDTRIRAIEGGVARVRASFSIGAGSDAEADRIFDQCQLRVSRGPGSLAVAEPEKRSRDTRAEAELEVEAPIGCSLRFEGVSADVSVSGLHGEQRYRTVSGDLLLNDAGGDLRINGVSADVTVRARGQLSLANTAVSGDLSAIAPRFVALQATSVSGDVEVEGAFAASGEHRVETVSGDLAVGLVGAATFEVRGMSTDISCRLPNEQQGGADRRRVIVGGGGPTFSFSSMSGDLSIRPPQRLAANEPPPPQAATADAAVDQLAILRALERGEIDVEEATRRLADAGPTHG